MTKIYLVRHGEKVSGKGDPELSDVGKIQAQKTALYLSKLEISLLYCSPSRRTKETAEIITKQLKLPVVVSELLKERANWGNSEKCDFDEFLKIWERASLERKWQPPIGDSSFNTGMRLEKFIQNYLKANHGDLVIVTHGGIIADYLRNIASEDELNIINPIFLERKDRMIKECSITTIEVSDLKVGPKIIEIANTNYLLE
jgi:probable phosphoglycerate mutase